MCSSSMVMPCVSKKKNEFKSPKSTHQRGSLHKNKIDENLEHKNVGDKCGEKSQVKNSPLDKEVDMSVWFYLDMMSKVSRYLDFAWSLQECTIYSKVTKWCLENLLRI